MKVAILFPGQGSQLPQMGYDLMNHEIFAKRMTTVANCLNIPIANFFSSQTTVKMNTEIAQPYIYGMSFAIFEMLKNEFDLEPFVVAGHSLGEYSALTAAEVLTFEDGLNLVYKRGLAMAQAIKNCEGAMAAIFGLKKELLQEICENVLSLTGGVVSIANYNSPTQFVISGDQESVALAIELAKQKKALKTTVLPVNGAFHTSLMNESNEQFLKEWNQSLLSEPKRLVVMNVNGQVATNKNDIYENIVNQMIYPVQWNSTMETISQHQVDLYLEVGPGRVLSGLCKSFNRQQKVMNVGNAKEFLHFEKMLNQFIHA